MNYLLIKRWASLLVVFGLLLQVWAPAVFAVDSENTGENEAVPTLTSENPAEDTTMMDEGEIEAETEAEAEDTAGSVDAEDEDDIIDTIEALVDVTTEENTGGSSDDALMDDSVDTVVELVADTFAGYSNEKVGEKLESLQARITEAISQLKEKLKGGGNITLVQQLILDRKIQHLERFQNKLRARIMIENKNAVKTIKMTRNNPGVYMLRWGVLENGQQKRCGNMKKADIRKAIIEGQRPESCNAETISYSGTLSVDKGTLTVKNRLLFEENDKVTTESGSSIAFESTINGYWDGLLVEYTPENADDRGEVNINVKLGTLDTAKTGAQIMGMHDIGNNQKLQIKKLMNVLPALNKVKQQVLINNRLKISNRLTQLRERLEELRFMNIDSNILDSIEEIINQTEEYNFDYTSATEVETEIAHSLSMLNVDSADSDAEGQFTRLKDKLGQIRNQARERKFNDEIIPFKDTDDDTWFTGFVAGVKAKGIINGYKDNAGNPLGEFRPANNITIAEALKIALETAKQGTSDGTPILTAAQNHWAKGYVKKAEELGLSVVSNSNLDLNRPATRGEVIRMVLEALGIKPNVVGSTDFSDVPGTDEDANFIQYGKELEIVSGDSGKTTFRPHDPINRAEVSKIASQIIEIILGENLD